MARRVLLIHNPTAGRRRGRLLAATLRKLHAAGCTVDVRPTARRGDAEAFARAADPDRYDVVAVAGGDGTLNEAANGLAGRTLPLAVIPLGTANVLAAEIGLRTDAEHVARTIAEGCARPIHLGEAGGRKFLMMAGVGFDADVVASVDPALKRRFGKGAYAFASLASLFRFPFRPYRVTIDGTTHEAASAVIAKGRFYAGRYVCAPAASLERPDLQVCLFLRRGWWNAVRYTAGLLTGTLARYSDVRVVPARTVAVEGTPGEPVQGDGDILTRLPASVAVADETLAVLVPAA